MRPRLSYANVMATVAVFIALGGASYAAINLPKDSVGSRQIRKNAVQTGDIARNAVRVGKLDKEAVKAGKLAENAVPSNRIRTGAVNGRTVKESSLGTVPTANYANEANVANFLSPAEPWHVVGAPGEPGFENGWSYPISAAMFKYEQPTFYRDKAGVVHLQGVVGGGTSDTAAFVLPPGFKPSVPTRGRYLFFPALCSGGSCSEDGTGSVRVGVGGDVTPSGTSITFLEGISFRAAP